MVFLLQNAEGKSRQLISYDLFLPTTIPSPRERTIQVLRESWPSTQQATEHYSPCLLARKTPDTFIGSIVFTLRFQLIIFESSFISQVAHLRPQPSPPIFTGQGLLFNLWFLKVSEMSSLPFVSHSPRCIQEMLPQ